MAPPTGEEEVLFDVSSSLSSNESPERSAIDSDRAAWNEFVKPGIVANARGPPEMFDKDADAEKWTDQPRDQYLLYSHALLSDV